MHTRTGTPFGTVDSNQCPPGYTNVLGPLLPLPMTIPPATNSSTHSSNTSPSLHPLVPTHSPHHPSDRPQCALLAAAFGLAMGDVAEANDARPKGCWKDTTSNSMYFNDFAEPSSPAGGIPVCYKPGAAHTHTCEPHLHAPSLSLSRSLFYHTISLSPSTRPGVHLRRTQRLVLPSEGRLLLPLRSA